MATSYDALAALGAPISLEEYQHLATGALGDALSFLSGHIVGRDAAATARRTLFSFQEAQAKSQLKQPATTRSRADKAAARIASGKTSSGVHSTQLEELQTKLNTSSMRATELRSNLNDKRTLILLLNVLEAKHELRTKRIEALTRAINELRKTAREAQQGVPNTLDYVSPLPPLQFPRVSHTRDRLADFHASTIRLRGETPPISIGLTLERERPTDRGLDAKNRANILKSNELQFLVKRSVILSLACERRLVSISTSRPILRQSALEVQEYVARVKGRVNILRGLIRATDPGGASRVESFARRVAKACRMPETSSAHAMVEEVERVVRRAHRRRVLLAQEQHLLLPLGDTVNISPIDTYQRTAEETHARAKLLLTRKGTKADSGRALATEVRQLLGEVKKVVGIAGKE